MKLAYVMPHPYEYLFLNEIARMNSPDERDRSAPFIANLMGIEQVGRYGFVKGDINDFKLLKNLAKDREATFAPASADFASPDSISGNP